MSTIYTGPFLVLTGHGESGHNDILAVGFDQADLIEFASSLDAALISAYLALTIHSGGGILPLQLPKASTHAGSPASN